MLAVEPVPASISATILARCAGVRLGLRPTCRPAALAWAKPCRVRSRIMARSNSAKAPSMCIIMRPAGVVVSMASVSDRKPAPARSMRSKVNRRSGE